MNAYARTGSDSSRVMKERMGLGLKKTTMFVHVVYRSSYKTGCRHPVFSLYPRQRVAPEKLVKRDEKHQGRLSVLLTFWRGSK